MYLILQFNIFEQMGQNLKILSFILSWERKKRSISDTGYFNEKQGTK